MTNDSDVQGQLPTIEVEQTDPSAEAILLSPTLLYDAGEAVRRLGVAGEDKLVRLLYLVFTSRVMQRPLSALIKGESAGGKSHLVSTVRKLIPKDGYRELTDATTQSFLYAKEEDLDHKIVIFTEGAGLAKANYSIRVLQSEGRLSVQVTIRNLKTGAFETKTNEFEAYTGFITTTTEAQVVHDSETRNLSAFIDESEEQTQRVLQVEAQQYALAQEEVTKEEIGHWQKAHRQLQPLPVIIPYATQLAQLFPKKPLRVRRDMPGLLALVETSAILHQQQREHIEHKGQQVLMASIADYHIAEVLVEEVLAQTILQIPPKTASLLRAAEEIGEATFTVNDLMAALDWGYQVTYKWLQPALDEGYVALDEPGRGRTPARYKLTRKKLEAHTILPDTAELYGGCPESWKGEPIYDPVTGDRLVLEEE